MPIRFYCPLGHRLVVPDERAGKKGCCPQCQQKVYVPVANPQMRSGLKQPFADRTIELDDVGDIPPEVLAPPTSSATPRGSKSRREPLAGNHACAAASQAEEESTFDSKSPVNLGWTRSGPWSATRWFT